MKLYDVEQDFSFRVRTCPGQLADVWVLLCYSTKVKAPLPRVQNWNVILVLYNSVSDSDLALITQNCCKVGEGEKEKGR